MKLYVGTSGYAHKEWRGLFYPEDVDPKEMLRFYGERLGAVEINYTFYHMPSREVLISWAAQVPSDFVFALKAPQVITHRKRLKEVEQETDYFFRTIPALKDKLGAVLFQFPANFRANLTRLEDFLRLIPGNFRCAFEFRSPTWLEGGVTGLLEGGGHCLCTADTDETPALKMPGSASWGYLRLRRSNYTEADLSEWLERIRAKKWEKCFVFFKHEEEAKGPSEALRFRELAPANS